MRCRRHQRKAGPPGNRGTQIVAHKYDCCTFSYSCRRALVLLRRLSHLRITPRQDQFYSVPINLASCCSKCVRVYMSITSSGSRAPRRMRSSAATKRRPSLRRYQMQPLHCFPRHRENPRQSCPHCHDRSRQTVHAPAEDLGLTGPLAQGATGRARVPWPAASRSATGQAHPNLGSLRQGPKHEIHRRAVEEQSV